MTCRSKAAPLAALFQQPQLPAATPSVDRRFLPVNFLHWLGNWLILISFTLLGFTPAQSALNDTGITTCSNATQNGLPCPVDEFSWQILIVA
jgi:hypothetical protein